MKKAIAVILALIVIGGLGYGIYYVINEGSPEEGQQPHVSFEIKGNRVSNFTYLLQYNQFQSADAVIAALEQSGYDLVIMDMYYSVGTNASNTPAQTWTSEQINALHDAGMIVLCYISIGEAENYRPYWNESWDADDDGVPDSGAPDWLDVENPDWPGNYKVHYWDPAWQDIVYNYLEKIGELGFDGVYLDIIDAYFYYEQKGMTNAADLMVGFVSNISAFMKQHFDNSFVICPQNAEELAEYEGYLSAVDGIGREDVFYSDDEKQPQSEIDNAISYLNLFLDAGKFVLDVEYPTQQATIADAMELSSQAGFVIHITTRPLDVIRVDQYP